jgi:hypothetical protein
VRGLILGSTALLLFTTTHVVVAGCSSYRIDRLFYRSNTVILVRVLESTFPGPPSSTDTRDGYFHALGDATAAVVVLRSWKGQLTSGARVQITQRQLMGGCCLRASLPSNQKFLIFAQQRVSPLEVTEDSVLDMRDALCKTSRLDSLSEKADR